MVNSHSVTPGTYCLATALSRAQQKECWCPGRPLPSSFRAAYWCRSPGRRLTISARSSFLHCRCNTVFPSRYAKPLLGRGRYLFAFHPHYPYQRQALRLNGHCGRLRHARYNALPYTHKHKLFTHRHRPTYPCHRHKQADTTNCCCFPRIFRLWRRQIIRSLGSYPRTVCGGCPDTPSNVLGEGSRCTPAQNMFALR